MGFVNIPDVPLATASAPGAAPVWPPPVSDARRNAVFLSEAPYYANETISTATVTADSGVGESTVTISESLGFVPHQGIHINDYFDPSNDYLGTVVSVSPDGKTIQVTPPFAHAVREHVICAPDGTVAMQAAIDDVAAAGGGEILVRGVCRIHGPIQDPTGANSVLKLPEILYGTGMQPIVVKIRGVSDPAFTDQGPSPGGAVILFDTKTTDADAAMISGYNASSTEWGPFTACFLTLEDITLRTSYDDPQINGVNGANIGRVQCRGNVVIGTNSGGSATRDRYALKMPRATNVPPGNCDVVVVQGFKKGVIAHERFHCNYLYSSFCDQPLYVASWDVNVEHMVVDRAESVISGSAGGKFRVGYLACDQVDVLVDDPDDLLVGDLTYTPLSGTASIVGAKNVRIREVGGRPVATGGDVTVVGEYKIHTFSGTGADSLTVTGGPLQVDVLIVAGGGCGRGTGFGGNSGDGGAGGQVIVRTGLYVKGEVAVVVGAGGVGTYDGTGTSGGSSSFAGIVAAGGLAGQTASSSEPRDGGDGAGGPGEIGSAPNAGDGGPGVECDFSGSVEFYGGGGGGGFSVGGAGGSGGGGHGETYSHIGGSAGEANTGGGGGGCSGTGSGLGFDGGSGIVIVRYRLG